MTPSNTPDGDDGDLRPNAEAKPEARIGRQKRKDGSSFAPTDYTDAREPLDWQSKYPPQAKGAIRVEIGFLAAGVLLAIMAAVVVTAGLSEAWFANPKAATAFGCYVGSIAGGVLGGALFSIKWLYHTVAKQTWHLDRRPWRFLSPLLAGGLAFAVMLMVQTKLFSVLNNEFVASPGGCAALGFLVGYFTDNTLAKLTEVAESVFGVSARDKGRRE